MRLNAYLKRLITLSLVLILSIALPLPGTITKARAEETATIKLNVNSQSIVKGKSFSLYVYNLCEGQTVSFESDSPETASVNETGLVTANAVGTATITVTVKEEAKTVTTLFCKITVGPAAISVHFSNLELHMISGQKAKIERILQPISTVEQPKFSSYNSKIASVSAGGRVTARAEGSTYIFAQIDNGRFAVCKVFVYPEGTVLTTEFSSPVVSEESSEESFEDIDFETFLKNLNAAGKNTAGTVNGTDETTN